MRVLRVLELDLDCIVGLVALSVYEAVLKMLFGSWKVFDLGCREDRSTTGFMDCLAGADKAIFQVLLPYSKPGTMSQTTM